MVLSPEWAMVAALEKIAAALERLASGGRAVMVAEENTVLSCPEWLTLVEVAAGAPAPYVTFERAPVIAREVEGAPV